MLRTAYRIVHLDINSSRKPLYAICEVTLDSNGGLVSWSPGDIRFRGDSTAGLLDTFAAIKAALDKPILSERELNDWGVRYIAA